MHKRKSPLLALKGGGGTWQRMCGACRSWRSLWLPASKGTRTSVLQPQGTGFCHHHVTPKEGPEFQMRTKPRQYLDTSLRGHLVENSVTSYQTTVLQNWAVLSHYIYRDLLHSLENWPRIHVLPQGGENSWPAEYQQKGGAGDRQVTLFEGTTGYPLVLSPEIIIFLFNN